MEENDDADDEVDGRVGAVSGGLGSGGSRCSPQGCSPEPSQESLCSPAVVRVRERERERQWCMREGERESGCTRSAFSRTLDLT